MMERLLPLMTARKMEKEEKGKLEAMNTWEEATASPIFALF